MTRFRLVPELDKHPKLLLFAATPLGKAASLALFLFLFWLSAGGQMFAETAIVLVLVTLFSEHRRTVLLFAALYWASVQFNGPWEVLGRLRPQLDEGVQVGDFGIAKLRILAAVLLCGGIAHWLFRSRPTMWPARQPVWALIAFQVAILAGLSVFPRHGSLWLYGWGFALVFSSYLWCFAYSLLDLRKNRRRAYSEQIGFFHPFWGSTNTPFPKGVAYADQIEARDPLALAVSQLKGLKLIWWALVLAATAAALRSMFFGAPLFGSLRLPAFLPIPPLEVAFRASSAGRPLPWLVNWSSTFLDLALDGLRLCVWGHQIIAVARFAGFNARRNSYKPFLSTSVSEFFNRYYYYFKELLVDCFFYQVFYALPRKRFRLALALSTMAAAGLGNYLYHFLRDLYVTVERGIGAALVASHMLAVYCFCLSIAIIISQIRRAGVQLVPRSRIATLRSVVLVWVTFAILNTLIVDLWKSDITQHAQFLADLLP
jgi:hypothetical protein